MKHVKTLTALSATALLCSAAIATPNPKPQTHQPAAPYDVQVTCKTIVKDANGKQVGQRVISDHSVGVVGSVGNPIVGASIHPQLTANGCWVYR